MATPARSVLVRAAAVGVLVLATTSWAGSPVAAAPPVGVSAAWTYAAGTGTVSLPGVSGFPTGVLTSDGGGGSVPAGGSAYLGPATPYGAAFGSTRDLPYFTVGAAGSAPSTTTITFPSPVVPGGWGFALGDVDADLVRIRATGTDGSPLTGAELGHQGTFNACDVSPRPGSCFAPYTDLPTWSEATATLTGNGADTAGATGWFRPTVAVRSITFEFAVLSGIPSYQLWVSGLEASASGTVTVDDPAAPPPTGSEVALVTPDGDPVPDPDGDPVVEVVDETGTFELPDVLTGEYVIAITPPPGTDAPVVEIPVDLRDGDVEDIAAVIVPIQATTTSTTPTSTTTTTTTPVLITPPPPPPPADAVQGRPTYTG